MSAQEPSTTQDDNLEEVLEKISEIARVAARRDYIYRGEPEHYDKVSSGLYRQHSSIQGEDVDLEAVHEKMLKDAKKYTGQTDEFEILAFLQHFGGKTNLIDFTEDYLVALFFACGTPNDRDGRIILLPRQIDDGAISIKKPWSPRHRVIAQKSVFVQTKKGYLEPDEYISIPKELKRPTLDHLQHHHGIKIEGIYNDLHGFIKQQTPISDPTLSPVSLTPEQEELCRRMDELHVLGRFQGQPSDMFLGALWVLEDERNPDRIAQAAHALREILYPILSSQVRALQNFRSAFSDVGLGRIYGRLTELAHHGAKSNQLDFPNFTRSDFDRLLEDFEAAMQRALIRPTDLDRQIDDFLGGDPPQ